jgi:hypothetical protein
VLGVTPPFSAAELRAAYRRLITRWHPDRFPAGAPEHGRAAEQAKRINVAYDSLCRALEAGEVPPPRPRARWTGGQSHRAYPAGFPDPSVAEVPVTSSSIVSVGYDEARRVLYIKFRGDRVHRYLGVPRHVYDGLLAAPSHGKYAHRHVYPSYPYEQC